MPRKVRWDCPVKGCTHRGYNVVGLWNHLYGGHNKTEVVEALITIYANLRELIGI